MRIDSPSNPKIKEVINWLKKPSQRRRDGVVVVEGDREIQRAIQSGWHVKSIFHTDACEWIDSVPMSKRLACSSKAFDKLVMRRHGVEALAVFHSPELTLSSLSLPDRALILVMDGIEKPGNIGAMMRTADALAMDAVIVSSPECDPLAPQAIRNSLGGIFHTALAIADREEVMAFLSEHHITPVLMHLEASQSMRNYGWEGDQAIVVGSEDKGLDASWTEQGHDRIIIPMQGVVDSLNVSVSAAIVMAAAKTEL